jgi:hypothetical protein
LNQHARLPQQLAQLPVLLNGLAGNTAHASVRFDFLSVLSIRPHRQRKAVYSAWWWSSLVARLLDASFFAALHPSCHKTLACFSDRSR